VGEGRRLTIGAYCGASRCHARLRDFEGRAIAEAQGSGGNLYVDFDAALATLDKRIDAICAKAGLVTADRARVTLGSASLAFPVPPTLSASRRATPASPACAPP